MVKVSYLDSQCGMNFVSNLNNAPTVKDQIESLDYAFNRWGVGSGASHQDIKSQIVFTDIISEEKTRWPEIKKISTRGPVTWNERYEVGSENRNQIAVYILTRADYYAWRETQLSLFQKAKEAIKNVCASEGPTADF